MKYVCPDCQSSRWKTVIKGKAYQCRNCSCVVSSVKEARDQFPEIKEAQCQELKLSLTA